MPLVVAVAALAAIAAIIVAWALSPAVTARTPRLAQQVLAKRAVVPPERVPEVEPIAYADVAPEEAREINAAVPFAKGPNPAARPFILKEPALDRARAQDCLAAAMLYEAGSGDPDGQRAVAQVVINRLRHPAFPKTICGVVFQGQERRTGCQFTFTCDGAITRLPRKEAWDDARKRAGDMLDGAVFKAVGHSTHYHTDWVVPYWSSSLDKVVAIRTHLFFRWTGWWGTPGAFRGRHAGAEPAIAKLAALGVAPAHTPGEGELPLDSPTLDVAAAGLKPVFADDGGNFVMLFDAATAADWEVLAKSICATRDFCKLLAWSDKSKLPRQPEPAEGDLQTLAFSYLRDPASGYEKALWNCQATPRPDPRQCMKRRVFLPSASTNSFRIEQVLARPTAEPKAADTAPTATKDPAIVVPPPVRRTVEGR